MAWTTPLRWLFIAGGFALCAGLGACSGTPSSSPYLPPSYEGPQWCEEEDDCRDGCRCSDGNYCGPEGTCVLLLGKGANCTADEQCESERCGSNLAGDRTICYAKPGDYCTLDDCELCEAMTNLVGKCASTCRDKSDCLGQFDSSRGRRHRLTNNLEDVLCVTSRVKPELKVCRSALAFGCYPFFEDSCDPGYHCSSTSSRDWSSFCRSDRFEDGRRCAQDTNCDSLICGPDRTCQDGSAGQPCLDDGDCGAAFLCGPDDQCHGGEIGDTCGVDSECKSSICTPLGECGSGMGGEPCERQSQCIEDLVCSAEGICEPVCSGEVLQCWDLAGTDCDMVAQCRKGRCEKDFGPCPRTKLGRYCTPTSACYIPEPGAWCTSRYCADNSYGDCNISSVCRWNDDRCGGEAPECDTLDATACNGQLGCALTPLLDDPPP